MTRKTFVIYKIIVAVAVGFVTSVSINNGNWYLPIIFIVAAWAFLFALKKRVREVMADERDYRLAGKASMHAMTIYSILAPVVGLFLYISGKDNAILFAIGNTLLYSACALILIYSLLFKVYERKDGRN